MAKENFTDRIRKVASLVGGQAELSRKTGISTVTIGSYVTGKSDPSRERLVAMARAAGVSVGWLAAGEGAMQPGGDECKGVNHLEEPIITELKLWLNEMSGDDPGWRTWFRMELLDKIPKFKEWREKNIGDTVDEQSAA